MKNYCFIFLAAVFFSPTQAQILNALEWEVMSVGALSSPEPTVLRGWVYATEPRIKIGERFSIGYRWENASFVANDHKVKIWSTRSHMIIVNSFLRTNSKHRPFLGLGFGNYKQGGLQFSEGFYFEDPIDSFGITTTLGYDFAFLRMALSNNRLFSGERKRNYLSLKIGLNINRKYDKKSETEPSVIH